MNIYKTNNADTLFLSINSNKFICVVSNDLRFKESILYDKDYILKHTLIKIDNDKTHESILSSQFLPSTIVDLIQSNGIFHKTYTDEREADEFSNQLIFDIASLYDDCDKKFFECEQYSIMNNLNQIIDGHVINIINKHKILMTINTTRDQFNRTNLICTAIFNHF